MRHKIRWTGEKISARLEPEALVYIDGEPVAACDRHHQEISTAFPIANAQRTNILEEIQSEIPVNNNQIKYHIKPYQILTLRIVPQPQSPNIE